ncbi:MAG: 1-acyl-sn-glycerol-3-phosphate acyltransferase [Anaerolineales bacterium]|jgi:hypothetical protein
MMATADLLADEIAFALGLPRGGWARRGLGLVFRRPIRELASIADAFDLASAQKGLPQGAEEALSNWCRGIKARGLERVPQDGPLLVVSNHPGTYDALVIASRLGRPDLRTIVSDIPFLEHLPEASRHFIFLDPTPEKRALAARQGIRHLRVGGALLLYGTGLIDPDPALYPQAADELAGWSRSIEVFMARVPGLIVLPCVVSHTLSPGWARSPLRFLRRAPLDRRRIVEFGQVIQQLTFPGRLLLSPCLSFGRPFPAENLGEPGAGGVRLAALIDCERELMTEHVAAFGGPKGL